MSIFQRTTTATTDTETTEPWPDLPSGYDDPDSAWFVPEHERPWYRALPADHGEIAQGGTHSHLNRTRRRMADQERQAWYDQQIALNPQGHASFVHRNTEQMREDWRRVEEQPATPEEVEAAVHSFRRTRAVREYVAAYRAAEQQARTRAERLCHVCGAQDAGTARWDVLELAGQRTNRGVAGPDPKPTLQQLVQACPSCALAVRLARLQAAAGQAAAGRTRAELATRWLEERTPLVEVTWTPPGPAPLPPGPINPFTG